MKPEAASSILQRNSKSGQCYKQFLASLFTGDINMACRNKPNIWTVK